jgi:hypothetical protein
MYNQVTQVQVSTDANLGSYLKKKIDVGVPLPHFLSKKELFSILHAAQLELFCLNFCEIILLPKVNEAKRIQHYRLICLLNVSFKVFTQTSTI